jgi:hypothetical protein
MILGANGFERGAPIGFYTSLIKATSIFDKINSVGSALTAFLIIYELFDDGVLLEIDEMRRK